MVRFSELFAGGASARVLEHFLENPSEKVSAASLVRKTKLSKKTVFDALKKYSFLLKRETVGRAILHSLDLSNPITRSLKVLLTVSSLVGEIPKDFEGQVFLFGSAARGEDTEKSDWDALVISTKRLSLKNPRIKPVFFNPLEYSALARKDKAFFDSMEKNKIRLR